MAMPKARSLAHSLAMRLICDTPPPTEHDGRPTQFGLQDKDKVLHPGTSLRGGAICYDFEILVQARVGQASPKFSGPFVHGPADAPFLYLSYREAQDGSPWIKRLKIMLAQLTFSQVEQALSSGGRIEGRISGQGSATVPLLGDGWRVQPSQTKDR